MSGSALIGGHRRVSVQLQSGGSIIRICREAVSNYQALNPVSGVHRIQIPATFEDIRQPDGSYQHLQTTTIRDAHGSVVFEDQYGEQGTAADDRYIERVYGDPAHPRLPTREELRDTTGRFLSRTTMRYAAQGQLLEQGRWLLETNQVVTTTSTYDARGLLLSETTPTGAMAQYGYDRAGHRTVMTDTLGFVTHYSYDAQGRLLSSSDPRGAQTSYQYDPISGLLQSTTNALGGVTSYQYDARKRKIAETNALGQTTRYGYNSLDQLVVMTDTLGLETRYAYTAQGQRAATRNPLGQRSSMRYNAANGWLVESRDPLGQLTRMDYDGQGRLVATMAPHGARTAQRYDAFGRVTVTLDPLGQRSTTQYDAQDRVIASTDALSNTTRYAYDSLGRMTVMTDTLGYATHYTYDADGRMTSSTDVRGATTSYRYDAAGRQIAVTNALSQTTRFGYDALGNQTVVTDTLGYTTRTTYDLLGRRIATTDALGQTTQYGYDALGNQTVMTDTLGFVTHSVYDAAQRRIAVTNALSETTRFGYDAVGNTTVITAALGHATHFVYDAANRRIATRDPLSRQSRTGYDALGHTVALTDTAGITSTMTYDLAGRVTSMTNGLGLSTQQQYDAAGRLIRRIRPDGVVTRYDYDAGGRLVQVVEHERPNQPADAQTNVTTQFSYDAQGNLLTISDANGHTQTFSYDLLGRQLTASDPLGHTQQLVYTPRGELDYRIDPMGRSIDYTYDALGRLTQTDYPDGTPDVTLQYNAASQVITMTDGLGQTLYGYDALGRMTSRSRDGRTVGYRYTATGQVETISYWDRGSVVAHYDDAGQLDGLTPWGAGQSSYTWRSAGLLATISRPNGVSTSFSYDNAHQLRRILQQQGASVLNDLGYTPDVNGNRTSVTEQLGGSTLTTQYQYDPLQRLSQAVYPAIPGGPAAQTVDSSLDAGGNRLNDGASYDAADRRVGFSYDDNGNLLADGTTTYSYDAANRLVQTVTGGVTTTYAYDGWGTLIRETRNGLSTDLVLDEQAALPRVLAAIRSDGYEELYAYGPEGLHAQRTITGTTDMVQYALLDAQGSLKHLTDTTGALTRTRVSDAWGTVRYSSGRGVSRLGYTGEWQDGSLVYLRARWYHTGLGSFTSRDSYPGTPERSASLHRYLYTEGNPVNWSDPSGQCVGWLWHSTSCHFAGLDARQWNYADGATYVAGIASNVTEPLQEIYTLATNASARDMAWNHLQHTQPADIPGLIVEGLVDPFRTFYYGLVCDDSYMLGKGAGGIGLEVLDAAGTFHGLSSARKMLGRQSGRFLSNKALFLTNLDEYDVRAILRSQGGWEEGIQKGLGYEGQPKWTKTIDGVTHEVRMHPTPTRLNRNIREGMAAYEGPISRYGVELVPGGQRRLPKDFKLGEPIPDNLKSLYDMDMKLRQQYGDQLEPMIGWGLHYLDPFGFAYVDEAGDLVGVTSHAGHIYGKNHPSLGLEPWKQSPYHPRYWYP